MIRAITIMIVAACGSARAPADSRSTAPVARVVPVVAVGPDAARWEAIDAATPAPTLHAEGIIAMAGAGDGRVAVASLSARLRVELIHAGVSIATDLASITATGRDSLAVTLVAEGAVVAIATDTKLRVVRVVRGTATEITPVAPPAPTTPPGLTSSPTVALDPEGRPVLATRAIAADHEVIEIRRFDGTRWIATRSARLPARYAVVSGVRRESCATIGFDAPPNFCTAIDPPAVVVDAARVLVVAWVSDARLRTARVERDRIIVSGAAEVSTYAITSPWGATPILLSRAPEPGWLAAFGDQLVDPGGPMREPLAPTVIVTGGCAVAGGAVLVAVTERGGSSLVWWNAAMHRAYAGGPVARPEIAVAGSTIVSLAPTANGLRVVKLDGPEWVPPAAAPLAAFLGSGHVQSLKLVAGPSGPVIAWLGGPSMKQPVTRIATPAGWISAGGMGGSIRILALVGDRDGPVAVTGDHDATGFRLVVKRWTGSTWVAMGAPIPSAGPAFATIAMADGAPIVAWIEAGQVRIARWRNASWQRSDGPPVQHAYRLAIDASGPDLRMVIASARPSLATAAWTEARQGWRMTTTTLSGVVHALAVRGELVAVALGHASTGELGVATSRGGRWERREVASGVVAADVAIDDMRVGVAWVRRQDAGFAIVDDDAISDRVGFPFAPGEGGGEVALTMSPRPCLVLARPSLLAVRCRRAQI
jgi:hypothetical protein